VSLFAAFEGLLIEDFILILLLNRKILSILLDEGKCHFEI
jgi:hypothetical protein